jgi:dihydrodipicolinate synthase/N-acetylneuraminate lyase
VFPREAVELFELAACGRWEDALALDRWLAPLLRATADRKRVQTIKLAQQVAGVGGETARGPRLPLAGAPRELVERTVRGMLERRPAPEAAR